MTTNTTTPAAAAGPTLPAGRARKASGPGENSTLTLLVLLAGIFIAILDFFIVNVALPATQHDLHTGSATVQWIVAGYGIALAAGLVTGGRIGDLVGRKRVYLLGLALFTLASAACGLAPDAAALIAARLAQGLSAALLMPQVLALINVAFTGAHRVRAYTGYGLALGLAAVFGQLIGGALIQANVAGLGWRSIYWINVPIGLVTLLLAVRAVPVPERHPRVRLDLAGAGLLSAALVALILPLVDGRQAGWPVWTWCSLAAVPVLLAVFFGYQRRLAAHGGAPLLDPALFGDRAFSAGLSVALVYSQAMASYFFVLALYLQSGRGMTPLSSGVLFTGVGGAYLATSLVSGRWAARLGRQVLALGTCVQGAGYAVLSVSVHWFGHGHSVLCLLPAMIVIGGGMGLTLAPMSGTVLAGVEPRNAAAAAGLLATMQQVGGALGVAVVGMVFFALVGTAPTPATFDRGFGGVLDVLAGICLATAGLVQLLPRRGPKA
ncbi:MAG TPA: MFS transporter [Actinocrinis sp.]|nr:MFS transporter [Actinocrinis sp.]